MCSAAGWRRYAQSSRQTRCAVPELPYSKLVEANSRAIPEFDHNQTKYPLRGMHQSVSCTQCHVKSVFTNVGQSCQDCHADIHKRQLGANCEQCHTVRGWQVSVQQVQQHNNRFPLTGAHAAVDCDSCHKGAATGQFQTLSTQCYSCHT